MTRWLLLTLIITLALPGIAIAQEEDEDDPSRIERFLEERLSDADGITVELEGFRGALSSTAELDRLIISDVEGPWLILENASLNWRRVALLRGVLDVRELTAERLEILRRPVQDERLDLPDAEAQPFSLPELPLEINVEELSIDRVVLGESIIGVPAELSVAGSADLGDGSGAAVFDITRLDGPRGVFSLDASYSNETAILALDLQVDEDAGGLLVELANIPDRPAIEVTLAGEGPITGFNADFALSTDGTPRLTGGMEITEGPEPEDRVLTVDLGGDIRPLFEDEYRDFFGDQTGLAGRVTLFADGRVAVDNIVLEAAEITLTGTVAVRADGQPDVIDVDARIADAGGQSVRLPIPGEVFVQEAVFEIAYDSKQGSAYRAVFDVQEFDADTIEIDTLSLTVGGTITQDEGGASAVTATISAETGGLNHADPALATALGPMQSLSGDVSWFEGAPVFVTDLVVNAGDLNLAGTAALDIREGAADLTLDVDAQAPDLTRFAAIADLPLEGGLSAAISGQADILSGAFDLRLEGVGRNLTIVDGLPPELLEGETTLVVDAARDETGLTLETLSLDAAEFRLSSSGRVDSEDLVFDGDLRFNDVGLLTDVISGPVTATIGARRSGGGPISAQIDVQGPAGLSADAMADIVLDDDTQDLTFALEAAMPDLSAFAEVVGLPLDGGLNASVVGEASLPSGSFDIRLEGQGQDLMIVDGIPPELLRGESRLVLAASRTDSEIEIETLSLETAELTINGSGRTDIEDGAFNASVRLDDIGIFTDVISGPVIGTVGIERSGGGPIFAQIDVQGPAGLSADATADIVLDDDTQDLTFALEAAMPDLSAFAEVVGLPLAGGLNASVVGEASLPSGSFDIRLEGRGQDLMIVDGIPPELLRGESRLVLAASRTESEIEIEALSLETAELTIDGSGRTDTEDGAFTATIRLADVGIFTDVISGPVSGDVSLERTGGGPFQTTAELRGPANINMRLDGVVGLPDGGVNLGATGSLPLELANRAIAPRSIRGTVAFDLTLVGQPRLENLGGTFRTTDARVSLPVFGTALEGVSLDASIAGGAVNADVTGLLSTGGRVNITARADLTTSGIPLRAEVTGRDLRLLDPTLFEVMVSTVDLTFDGSVQGASSLSGRIAISEAELLVPEGSIGTADIPPIQHINETWQQRQTRLAAGLGDSNGNGGGPGPTNSMASRISVDIQIDAPERIFVRGRGLDAELGGSLQVGGTAADVIPTGQIDLIRGRWSILGIRLDLDQGSVSLQGDFNPLISLRASSRAGEYTVEIALIGPLSAPEISLSSDPPLPEDEVLAQLLFGRSVSSLSPVQLLRLADTAAGLAGGSPNGGIFSSLREGLGLDDLDIQTDETGGLEVRAGRYLSENVYSDVTLGPEGRTDLSLNIDLTDNITARGTFSTDGDSSLGVFFERDY